MSFADGDLIVATRDDIINGNYNGSKDGTITLRIIDTKEDKEVCKVRTNPTTEIVGTASDGRVITYDNSNCEIVVWDKALSTNKVLGKAGYGCIYDAESERIVFMRYGSMCFMTLDGNVTRYMDKMYASRIEAYDPETNSVVICDSEDGDNSTIQEYSLISLDDNDIKVLTETTHFSYGMFCGKNALISYPYGKKSTIDVINTKSGSKLKTWQFKGDSEIVSSPFCDRILVKVNKKYAYNYVKKSILIADPATGKYADTGITLKDVGQMAVFFDKASEHYFIVDSVKDKETKTRLIELCPGCFDLTEDIEEGKSPVYERPELKYKLGSDYDEVRKKADDLEKKYGVEILMGNEIKDYTISYAYKLTSFEDSDLNLEDKKWNADHALEVLDGDLAIYPEGFFEKFKDYRGKGGVVFVIVDRLINEHGNFTASGEYVARGPVDYIVIDYNWLTPSTPHHEIWHATENLIVTVEPDAFDPEEWNKLNPEGFTYTEDFEKYDNEDYYKYCKPDYYDDSDEREEIYFARVYGTVNPREDRATMMECFVGDLDYYDTSMYKSLLELVYTYPHLKAKIEFIGAACEKVFGYRYWQK